MQIKILNEHFVFVSEKTTGSVTGGVYTEISSQQQWLIKQAGSFNAIKEAFAANLFALFTHNFRHSPETELIEGSNPNNNQKQYMLASQIRPGYLGFKVMQGEVPYAFDEKHQQQRVHNRPIKGMELVIMVSALLREGDFEGNGSSNVGFDVNPAAVDTVNGFRIDFDQTLDASSSCYPQSNTLGDMIVYLASNAMVTWRLLDRQEAWLALQHIATISDEDIDRLFDHYKVYFNLVIEQEASEQTRLRYQNSLAALTQTVIAIKQDKNQLPRLSQFQNPRVTTPLFAKEKLFHPDIKEIACFFTLYDNFYTSLYEEFPLRSAKALIIGLRAEGEKSKAFQDYQAMKNALLAKCQSVEGDISYRKKYLVDTRKLLDTKYADKMTDPVAVCSLVNIDVYERILARLSAEMPVYQHLRATISATDQLLAAIAPQTREYCHNIANYAVLSHLYLSTDRVEFTLRSAFPGDIKDPHGKTCDAQSWANRVENCRAILSAFAEEVWIDGDYHYYVSDSPKDALIALKEESDHNEPYKTPFIDEMLARFANPQEYQLH